MKDGRMVGGRYRILNLLGTGGVGRTYRAFDERLKRYVAVKEFFPIGIFKEGREGESPSTMLVGRYEKLKDRFLEEARKLAKIKHEGIPEVYDILEEKGSIYMIMELVEGKNLREFVGKMGKLDLNFALEKFLEMCDVVNFMHERGIIHCDLKPDNVIIKDDGRIKIVDFGSAREYIGEYTQTQPAFLTPGYAPIELYAFRIPKGPFTDVYSLGGILYFMLTGRDPVSAPDRVGGVALERIGKFNPEVPEYIEKIVLKAMSMDPTERYRSVRDLKKALENETVEFGRYERRGESGRDEEMDMEEAVFFSGCLKILILSIITFILIFFTFRFCTRFLFIP